MASLTTAQQKFVVTELAQFQGPAAVVEAVKEEYGIEVSRQQVDHYNPATGPDSSPADKWCELFEETRRAFLKDTSRIAIAHRGYRLRRLMRLHDDAEADGDRKLAAELLEQAAKEVGGLFTNRRTVEVDPRGGLARILGVSPDDLPEEL